MDLLVHIGLPKTGTTTIQDHVLKTQPGYLGRSRLGKSLISNWEVEKFRTMATRHRFLSSEKTKSEVDRFVGEITSFSQPYENSDKLILSDEGLSRWFSVNVWSDAWPVGSKPKVEGQRKRPWPFAQFIRDYLRPAWQPYGDVQVILTLRNQADYLASLYAERSNARRNASQEDFENQVTELLKSNSPTINWYSLVEDLEEVLGCDGISVLLYEEMGYTKFWEEFGNAFGIKDMPLHDLYSDSSPKENVRAIEKNVWGIKSSTFSSASGVIDILWPSGIRGKRFAKGPIQRVLDPVLDPIFYKVLERNREGVICMTEDFRARIRDHCADSNQRLGHRLNRDLKSLGY